MLCRRSALCALAFAGPILCAQAPPSKPAAPPTDPDHFLVLARTHNDIDIEGVTPWELKATFQLFDSKGLPEQTLTLDELWAGPDQQRLTWTGPQYHRTTITNHDGTFRTGSSQPVPTFVESALQTILHPVPDSSVTSATTLRMQEQKFGKEIFNCVVSIPTTPPPMVMPLNVILIARPIQYCFEISTMNYRITLGSSANSRSDSATPFQTRNAAKQDAIAVGKIVRAKGTVDDLSVVPQPDPQAFVAPAGAIKLDSTAHKR
jgi:hypothetical protein